MNEADIDKLLADSKFISLDPYTNITVCHVQLDTKLLLLQILSRKLDATLKINQWRNNLQSSLSNLEKSSKLSSYCTLFQVYNS